MGYERNDRRYGGGFSGDRDRGYGSDADRARSYGNDYREGQRDDRGYTSQYRSDAGRDAGQRGGDQDRGFFDRAGDEVRSWFGDDDAERRRRQDDRDGERTQGYDRGYGARDYARGSSSYAASGSSSGSASSGSASSGTRDQHHDTYQSWRDRQLQAFDQDYDEYRREHQSKFDSEFHSWRQNRQGQRDLLQKVQEHQEVVGSDGQHVGTVDHVRGDRIQLTKSDKDAGGHHHTIPSSWLQSVDDKVTVSKTADQAKQHWREDDGNQGGLFGGGKDRETGGANASKSFSGTY